MADFALIGCAYGDVELCSKSLVQIVSGQLSWRGLIFLGYAMHLEHGATPGQGIQRTNVSSLWSSPPEQVLGRSWLRPPKGSSAPRQTSREYGGRGFLGGGSWVARPKLNQGLFFPNSLKALVKGLAKKDNKSLFMLFLFWPWAPALGPCLPNFGHYLAEAWIPKMFQGLWHSACKMWLQ